MSPRCLASAASFPGGKVAAAQAAHPLGIAQRRRAGIARAIAYAVEQSRVLARISKECVINLPTVDMAAKVVGIGNCSGRDTDKFARFNLTAVKGAKVMAPLIMECYANFEGRLHDASLINKYSLFVWEVVKAHVARSPRYPRTLHYRGDGEFMISGPNTARYRRLFKPEML